ATIINDKKRTSIAKRPATPTLNVRHDQPKIHRFDSKALPLHSFTSPHPPFATLPSGQRVSDLAMNSRNSTSAFGRQIRCGTFIHVLVYIGTKQSDLWQIRDYTSIPMRTHMCPGSEKSSSVVD